MFVTADQIVCHAVGDYILQSDWMASEKTKKSLAAFAHVATYSLPFLFLTTSWKALLFIAGTHFIIDRWRLARYVCWVKNYLSPRKSGETQWWRSWSDCAATGYPPEKPLFLTLWLMIITDNLMHVCLNAAALRWLT